MAGANLIYGAGMLDSGLIFSYAQLVIDNDIFKMIRKVMQGMHVDDENLAVDVIHDVGPLKDFLAQKHTLKHMRSQSQPSLIDRRRRSKWEELGGTDIYERAAAKAREILETHEPDPLPEDVLATIRSIIEGAEEELGVGKQG